MSEVRPLLIVGNPRTGSTLLSTLLLQHPDVHVHGELFHPIENERRGTHALRHRRKAWFDPETDDAILFLDEHVFGVSTDYKGRRVSVVGVKIFADHISSGGATHLFRRFHGHYPDAAVLHMRRDDYLSTLVSLEFARRTRQWVNWSHDPQSRAEVSSFSIPVKQALAFFDRMWRADAYFSLTFSGPNYLPVHYSRLVVDLPGTMSSVFASLGVPDHPVSMVTEKQVSGEDWSLVENLPDLQSAFAAWQVQQEV
jgi:LPS sulfotransferase NodH